MLDLGEEIKSEGQDWGLTGMWIKSNNGKMAETMMQQRIW